MTNEHKLRQHLEQITRLTDDEFSYILTHFSTKKLKAGGFDTPRNFDQYNVGATNIVVAPNQVSQLQIEPAYLTVDREIEVAAP